MILSIVSVLLLVIVILMSYIVILSLRRINQYENFILQISQIVEFATAHMKRVDASGHYESDDETGFFFNQLKEIQLLLNNIFESKEKEGQDATKKD